MTMFYFSMQVWGAHPVLCMFNLFGHLNSQFARLLRDSVGAAGWKNTADTLKHTGTGVAKVRTTKQACWGDRVEEHRKHDRDT